MSEYENLSLFVSIVAVSISVVSILWQLKAHKDTKTLRQKTEELAAKQLSKLKQKEHSEERAELTVGLYEGKNSSEFYIINKGASFARNITFSLVMENPELSPLIAKQIEEMLPYPLLEGGDMFKLLAAITSENPRSYSGIVGWLNPDGEEIKKEFYVTLQ